MDLYLQEQSQTDLVSCPLCTHSPLMTFLDRKKDRTYFHCDRCGFIFLSRSCLLTGEAEKKRYLQHKNALHNSGYLDFITSFLEESVKPYIQPGEAVLDFGSGPVPALSWLLRKDGYNTDSYDPFFHPDNSWETKKYKAVVLLEVLEHLASPVETLGKIKSSLRKNGFLCIRSNLHQENISDFSTWWYRQDPTHISFFSERTIHYLSSKLGLSVKAIKNNRDIILLSES